VEEMATCVAYNNNTHKVLFILQVAVQETQSHIKVAYKVPIRETSARLLGVKDAA
jgi:hypothetical protein